MSIERFHQVFVALWQIPLVRYGMVGLVSTSIHVAVAFALLGLVGFGVFAANLLGFLCAYGFSYLVQARYVFLAKVSWWSSIRFSLVQLAGLLVSMQVSGLLTDTNPYVRTLVAVLVIPLITFFIHKIWTFSTGVGKA